MFLKICKTAVLGCHFELTFAGDFSRYFMLSFYKILQNSILRTGCFLCSPFHYIVSVDLLSSFILTLYFLLCLLYISFYTDIICRLSNCLLSVSLSSCCDDRILHIIGSLLIPCYLICKGTKSACHGSQIRAIAVKL